MCSVHSPSFDLCLSECTSHYSVTTKEKNVCFFLFLSPAIHFDLCCLNNLLNGDMVHFFSESERKNRTNKHGKVQCRSYSAYKYYFLKINLVWKMFPTLVEMFISLFHVVGIFSDFINRIILGHFMFLFIVSFFHRKKDGKKIYLLNVFIPKPAVLAADDMTGIVRNVRLKIDNFPPFTYLIECRCRLVFFLGSVVSWKQSIENMISVL